jgi:plasmid stability protein
MSAITIRKLPDHVHDALRRRAKEEGKSVEAVAREARGRRGLRVDQIVPGSDVLLMRLLGPPVTPSDAETGRIYLWRDTAGGLHWQEGSQLGAAAAAVVWPLHLSQWYVRSYALSPGDGLPVLCRRRPTRQVVPPRMGASECLVEGVENLRVHTADPPLGALDQESTQRARSAVHVAVLLRAPLPLASSSGSGPYRLLDEALLQADDHYLRSVIHLTRPLSRWPVAAANE